MNYPDPKNNQAVFDFVIAHLRKQGVRARLDTPTYSGCAYRGVNGTKCAVGCLIPDEEYSDALEGHCIAKYGLAAITRWAYSKGYDLNLLEHLQALHDYHLFADRMEDFEKAVETATAYLSLVYTPPKE